jgi:hypothetical protein
MILPIISYTINIIVILIIIYIFYVVYKKQKEKEEDEESVLKEYLENCIDVEYWSYISLNNPNTLLTCTAYYQVNNDIYINNLGEYQEGILLETLSDRHPFYNINIFDVNNKKGRYFKKVLGYDLKEWYSIKNPISYDIVIYTNGVETIFYFTDDSIFRTINIFKIKKLNLCV